MLDSQTAIVAHRTQVLTKLTPHHRPWNLDRRVEAVSTRLLGCYSSVSPFPAVKTLCEAHTSQWVVFNIVINPVNIPGVHPLCGSLNPGCPENPQRRLGGLCLLLPLTRPKPCQMALAFF